MSVILTMHLSSEMLANELLSSLHGQVALKAVHRFLTHNPEWVGQVSTSRGKCSDVHE